MRLTCLWLFAQPNASSERPLSSCVPLHSACVSFYEQLQPVWELWLSFQTEERVLVGVGRSLDQLMRGCRSRSCGTVYPTFTHDEHLMFRLRSWRFSWLSGLCG